MDVRARRQGVRRDGTAHVTVVLLALLVVVVLSALTLAIGSLVDVRSRW